MNWQQSIVVTWVEFFVAATLVLWAGRGALRWYTQPVERIRLIQCTLAAVMALPAFVMLAPWPVWRLGVFPVEEAPRTVDARPGQREGFRAAAIEPIAEPSIVADRFPMQTATSFELPVELPFTSAHQASDTSALSTAVPSANATSPAESSPDLWLSAAILIAVTQGLALLFFCVEWLIGTSRLRRLCREATIADAAVHEAWRSVTGGRRVARPERGTSEGRGERRQTLRLLNNIKWHAVATFATPFRILRQGVPPNPPIRILRQGVPPNGALVPPEGGTTSRVRLLVSAAIDAPLVFGWRRPVVVVPRELAEAGGTPLLLCLAHEWSHIERGDVLASRCVGICQLLLWCQPLFWKLRREMRICQDLLADDRSARSGGTALEYSELLVGLARRRVVAPAAGALTFIDNPGQLTRRVKMLLQPPSSLRTRCTWMFSLCTTLVAGISALALSAVRLDTTLVDDSQNAATGIDAPMEGTGEENEFHSALAAENRIEQGESATGIFKAEDAQDDSKQRPAKPAAEKPAALKYTCRVIDKETGRGIPQARIEVRRSILTSAQQENRLIETSRHTSDAEGTYVVEIPPEQVAERYLYIDLDVEHDDYAARKGFGYALSMIRKNEPLGERPFFETTELYPAEAVSGAVLSAEGVPLVGIKVLGYSRADVRNSHSGSFNETRSGPDGRFRLNLHKEANGVIWVMPKDHAIVEKYVAKQRGDLGEFRLQPGLSVRGRVLSAEGTALAGVALNISHTGDRDLGDLSVASSVLARGAVSDAEGRFAFDPLPPGDYRVTPAEHLDDFLERDRTVYAVPGVFISKKVTLKEGGEPAPLEIQAVPHVVLNAQVVNSKGEKTAGHMFSVFGELDGTWWHVLGRPDKNGTVALCVPHGLQKTRVDLHTNEHGALRYRRGKGQPLQNGTENIDFGTMNDDVTDFEIVRYRAPIVLVGAVDEANKPIKDFLVTATYPWGKQEYVLKGEQRSDLTFGHQNDGRYRTSQMLPDEEVTFTATAPGHQAASEKLKLAEGETKELSLVLKREAASAPVETPKEGEKKPEKTAEPAAETSQVAPKPSPEVVPPHEQPAHLTYQCMVVDRQTGNAIPNATVTVERSDSSLGHWPYPLVAKTTHVTDAEGRFTFEISPEQSGLRFLSIQIYAEHADYVRYFGTNSLSRMRKSETAGARPFFERLRMRPADRVTGKVVSPAGAPLGNVKVSGFTTMKAGEPNNISWIDTKTTSDGTFRVNKLKGGVAFVWIAPDDFSIAQRFVSQDLFELGEIRVAEGIRLRGRALSAEGKPVAGAAINAYYEGPENEPLAGYSVLSGIRRGAITDTDGRFVFDPLPAGDFRVVPQDELWDPRREQTLHPLPGVFIGKRTTLKEGLAPSELELQAVPHINFHAQHLDSQAQKQRGHEFFVAGRFDSEPWSARARPDQDGTVTVRLPHGLRDAGVHLVSDDDFALRHRKGRGRPIENHNYNVRLGTLNDDVEGFEIIRYTAPIIITQALDEASQPIKDFQVVAHYAWMKNVTNYVAETTGSHVRMSRQRDGRQRTTELLPDEEVTVTVTASGYEPATETLSLPEGETKELALVLKKSSGEKVD